MKLYRIEFNNYTDTLLRNCVVKINEGEKEYKLLPKAVIIKEEDISKAMEYGNGIKSMLYLGDFVEFNS